MSTQHRKEYDHASHSVWNWYAHSSCISLYELSLIATQFST